MKDITMYFIEAMTGCSCCHDENHTRGPYSNKEFAEGRVQTFREEGLLGSQFAPKGIYRIEEWKGKEISNGKLILEDTEFEGFWDLDQELEERVY